MTIVDRFLSGEIMTNEKVNNAIDLWHDSSSLLELHEWLGFTLEEYALFVTQPRKLEEILQAHLSSEDKIFAELMRKNQSLLDEAMLKERTKIHLSILEKEHPELYEAVQRSFNGSFTWRLTSDGQIKPWEKYILWLRAKLKFA